MKKIGFIGLGSMGNGICNCLMRHHYTMTVFDINKAATDSLKHKAVIASDPLDVLEKSDIVFLSLPSSKEVETVVDQFLERDMKNKIIVDTSTSYPLSTRKLNSKIKEAGGFLIDAPLLGNPKDGEKGTFNSVVGGDPDICAELDPLFMSYCKKYDYVGPSGNGHLIKIAMNYLGLSYAVLIAQMFPLLEKMNLDIHFIDTLFRNSPGLYNGVYNFYAPKIIDKSYEKAFALELGLKDLVYMQKMFNEFNTSAFTLDGVIDLLRVGLKDGRGENDFSECAATMREFLMGGVYE